MEGCIRARLVSLFMPSLPPSLPPSLGVARMHVGLLEEAKADLLAAAKADPQNKDIRVQVGR